MGQVWGEGSGGAKMGGARDSKAGKEVMVETRDAKRKGAEGSK